MDILWLFKFFWVFCSFVQILYQCIPFCCFLLSAVDHTHCSSNTRAQHEVSYPHPQPQQGLLNRVTTQLQPLWCSCFQLFIPSSSSVQCSVQLNRRVISDIAITEPRTFLSLAKLARARQQEGFRAALGDGKEPPGVLSRVMLQ